MIYELMLQEPQCSDIVTKLNNAMDKTGVAKDLASRTLIGDILIRFIVYPDSCSVTIDSVCGLLLITETLKALIKEYTGEELNLDNVVATLRRMYVINN